jgi:hypothetical protein
MERLEGIKLFKRPKSLFDFMDDLRDEFVNNFEGSMNKHAENLSNYLSGGKKSSKIESDSGFDASNIV